MQVMLTQKQMEQVIQALEQKPKSNQYLLNYLKEIQKKDDKQLTYSLDEIPF
jgi:uncharacterized protein (DUF1778 family)